VLQDNLTDEDMKLMISPLRDLKNLKFIYFGQNDTKNITDVTISHISKLIN